jgi:hypothetical protein
MKKVLAVALICAVSSFAAWDKFPVVGDGKGEAMVSFGTERQGSEGGWGGAGLGIRYSPLENLELTASQAVFDTYTLGARYQIIPVLAFGVDVGFPLPSRVWTFYPSIQFSMEFGSIALGSNVGLAIYTEDPDYEDYDPTAGYISGKYSKSMNLDAGIEIDCNIGKSTIWVGFDIETAIGESKLKIEGVPEVKTKAKDEERALALIPSVGYIANVSDNLSLGTSAAFGFGGKDAGNDPFTTTVAVDATVKF